MTTAKERGVTEQLEPMVVWLACLFVFMGVALFGLKQLL